MKNLVFKIIAMLTLAASQFHAFAQLTPAIPPNIVTSAPRPMIMLNMSKDHQLFYRAYDEFSDLDNDGIPETTYKHSFTYYGYFDPYKCYSYSGTSNKFSPASVNTNKYCSGDWSGNFLNWATMTRMDVVRKVLYGGNRATDSATTTVLERANLPTDAHSFAKYYKGSDLPQLTPFSASQLANERVISNNNTAAADRKIEFLNANNTLHITTAGTTPAGATAQTCETLVTNLFVGNTASIPPSYHCITYSVDQTAPFTISMGDQIRALNTALTSQYIEGFVVNFDAAAGWFTLAVAPTGFVATGAPPTIRKWTLQNLTQTSATICNTTLGDNLTANSPFNTNTAGNGDSHTNANPPLMRIAKGDYQLWNANERWQCYWQNAGTGGEKSASNGNNVGVTGLASSANNPRKDLQGVTIAGSGPDFIVRVDACKSSALIGTENCKEYPDGNFKPIGLLHEYGEGNLAEFGLLTGSFAKNISGGTLRSNMQSFQNEVNYTTNGTFSAAQGIVYTMNKLRVYGYRYSDGTYIGDGNCTYQLTTLNNNQCTSWGNPLGEMFIESLRYLGGKTGPSTEYDYTDAGSKDAAMGLPKPAWIDPFNKATPAAKTAAEAIFGQGQCRAVNAINFNASVISYDDDNGTDWAPFATLPIESGKGLVYQITMIGSDEGIHDPTKSWFIGNSGGTNTNTCTGKVLDGTANTLATSYGLCPDAPSYHGSYALAGAAYWARTHPVRLASASDLQANEDAYKVKSFSVALSPGKPRIEIPHPTTAGAKVVIQPTYQLVKGTERGSGTIVDFRVVGTPTATSGKFLIVWEDSEQGGDYDSDVSGILRYEVVGSKLYVYTRVFNAATANPQGFGYTISGTTRDGAHFHSGILGYTRADAGMVVTQSDGTAHANIVNGGCDNCQVNQPESRAEYDFGTTAAQRLEDPLWYAAKWGGFNKVEEVTSPVSIPKKFYQKPTTDKINWDVKKLDGTSGADGVPDSYFLAIRPSELEKSLRAAFNAIVSASNTAPAVASAQIQAGSLKYLASFDGDDGHGELITFSVQADGSFNTTFNGDGTLNRNVYTWAGHTKLTATAAADRNIITNTNNNTGIAFTWAALPAGVKTSALGGTDSTAQAKLDWLRGNRTDESPNGLRFRKRNLNSIMGPVVNSNPTVMVPPNADYFGAAFPGYGSFVSLYKTRKSVIWVGSGDGMLHGFDSNANATIGGTPIMSYVPQLIHSRLQDWVSPGTEKVQSFVDGTPFAADVLLGSTVTSIASPGYDPGAPAPVGWRTYVFASLGRGAKGMFALDATDPVVLTQANASSIFKWQFSETDDTSGDLGYNLSQIGSPSRVSDAASPVAKMNNGKFAVLLPNGVNSTSGKSVLYILFANGPSAGAWVPGTNYIKLVADTGPANGLAQATWVDINNDGVADYIYAGDLKGNLWKFDVSNVDPSLWNVAYGGRPLFVAKSTNGTTRLPITTAPEYRFHPLGGMVINVVTGKSITNADFPDTSGKVNGVFGIWDKPLYSSVAYVATPTLLDDTTNGLPRTRAQLAARTMTRIILDDADPLNGKVGDGYVSGASIDWTNSKGWYLNFPDSGEMAVSNPVITQGLLSVVSIAPATSSANVCFKGPVAYVTTIDPISGLLDHSVFGTVTIGGVIYNLASIKITDQRVTFARDATKTSCASGERNCTRIIGETTDVTAESANASARIYWREIPSFKTKASQ